LNEKSAYQLSQPQLVFADLDGTLIIEPASIGPRAVDLITLASATGGAVVPVSARSISHLAKLFYEHPQVSFAVGNGGAVIAKIFTAEKRYSVLHEETLTVQDGTGFVSSLYKWQEDGRGLIFLFHSSDSLFEVGVVGDVSVLGPSNLALIVGDRPMTHTEDPFPSQKLLGVSFLAPLESHQIRALLPQKNLPDIWRSSVYPEYRVPGWSWLEIFPESANKAKACQRVLQLWSTEFGRKPVTTAIGDANDDIGMLRFADQSYCPSSASEEVQKVVSEVLPQPGGDDFAAAVTARINVAIG
jgi:hydroxymethylpyrimidine pyrophosphatase-like HAD family hydrolase